jgi:hypothetical protein
MFKLDNALLEELGLGTLQLDEIESYIDKNDEPGALKWLETNFPNYKQVVADELEKLKGEIKASADQIVAAAQQPPAA